MFLKSYRDDFSINLCADPPPKVRPLHIHLKPGARPFRSTQRRYAPKQRSFLSDTVRKLESVNAIFKNPQAKWASPALAVAKTGSEEFRFTVDLRIPNSQTIPIVSVMPHLESMMQTVGGSKFFAKIDMAHAYCWLPLGEESKPLMSIQTPLGVYSSNRLLQGSTHAGNHFQSVTSEAFSVIADHLVQWMDDSMIHAESENQLLQIIQKFLKVCKQFGFKINAKKTILFSTEASFCGRTFPKNGSRFNTEKVSTLKNMLKPTKGNELQQFLCAANWMRNSIPQFATITAPLHDIIGKYLQTSWSKDQKGRKESVFTWPMGDGT